MSDTITEISKLIKRQECESMKPVEALSDPNAESSNSDVPVNENSAEKLPVGFNIKIYRLHKLVLIV